MPPVENFRKAMIELGVDQASQEQLLHWYEKISDKAPKARRAAFFRQVIQRMDGCLAPETCRALRDACACSKGGWRLEQSKKKAKETDGVECSCPVFQGTPQDEPVGLTYCYCCIGHFRFHYQVGLEMKLKTRAVLSSELNSCGKDPCRLVYEVES